MPGSHGAHLPVSRRTGISLPPRLIFVLYSEFWTLRTERIVFPFPARADSVPAAGRSSARDCARTGNVKAWVEQAWESRPTRESESKDRMFNERVRKRATGRPFASWGAVDCSRTSERERCPPPAVFARLGRCSRPLSRDAYFRPRVAIHLGAHILPPSTMIMMTAFWIHSLPCHIPCQCYSLLAT